MNDTRKKRLGIAAAVAVIAVVNLTDPNRLAAQGPGRIEVQITADDMCCQGCAQKVAAQLYAAPGVTNVAADVPSRIVKVTAKPSPTLTLERLWRAVEKGKGAPSKLITSQATYALTKAAQLPPAERLAPGTYVIELTESSDAAGMEKTRELLRSMPGVELVDADVRQHVLTVLASRDKPLSEWALVRVAKQAGQSPVRVAGPFGRLTIEYALNHRGRTARHPSNQNEQGGVR
jgi:copper chaperone CopZ